MDRKARRDIQKFEEEVYKRTGVGSTRPRQKNENKSRCVVVATTYYEDK